MKKILIILSLFLICLGAKNSHFFTLTIRFPVAAEYRCGYVMSDGNLYSTLNASSHPVSFPLTGGRTVDTAVGGFNSYNVISNDGYVFINRNDGTANWAQYSTDTTGAAFNDNTYIDAYADTWITIRANGSVWLAGNDTLHFFHTSDGVNMRPTQLSPGGMVVKKALLGGSRIVLLTTSGQVWENLRNSGSTSFTQKTVPGGIALDIWNSSLNYAGCIIPATVGATMGFPYVWGNYFSAWGGTGTLNQPTSMTTLWGVTTPIKSVCVNWQTTHWIDSLGRMWGLGFNVQGEVGNGQERVNKYTYSNLYSWNFTDGQNFSGVPAQQIGAGILWKKLFSCNWYAFYKVGMDSTGNLYAWGRNKAIVCGNGYINMQEATYPNSLDLLTPTLIRPDTATYQQYNVTLPTISAGSTQTITSASTTLTGSATPLLILANGTLHNGQANISRTITGYAWSQVSGPNTATIVSASSSSTLITGMITGTYVFALVTTDDNTGTQRATVSINTTVTTNNYGKLNIPAGSRIKFKP